MVVAIIQKSVMLNKSTKIVVYSPDARLPTPIFHAYMITFKYVHRSHVTWPKGFVILDMEVKYFSLFF